MRGRSESISISCIEKSAPDFAVAQRQARMRRNLDVAAGSHHDSRAVLEAAHRQGALERRWPFVEAVDEQPIDAFVAQQNLTRAKGAPQSPPRRFRFAAP